MTIMTSVAIRNAMLDQFETTLGASPLLRIFSGAVPANVAAADPATKLVEIALPADAFAAASAGSKAKSGTWAGVGLAAAGAGTDATSFRLYTSGGVAHYQGTVGEATEDMVLDNSNIAEAQNVTVTAFSVSLPDGA